MPPHASTRALRTIAIVLAAAAPFALFTSGRSALDDRARRAAIDGVVDALQAKYIAPDCARAIVERVRAGQARGEYDRLTSRGDLAAALTAQLQDISQDRHLRVEYHGALMTAARVVASAAGVVMRANDGLTKVRTLPGNVGYLRFSEFTDVSRVGAHLAEAMRALANTDALIIDVRGNRGGSPDGLMYLAGFFVERPTLVARIVSHAEHDTVPMATAEVPGPPYLQNEVYVLTDRQTFAAGEAAAYHLRQLGRAIVVGDTTAGGAHRVARVDVAAGLTVLVPETRPISVVTNGDWEGMGVVPDVAVPPTAALVTTQLLALHRLPRTSERARVIATLEAR